MLSVFRNPYQTYLETEVQERTVVGRNTRIVPADTILPHYHYLRLLPEAVRVDEYALGPKALQEDGSLLLPGHIKKDRITLSIPFEGRIRLQKQVTARLILRYLTKAYFGKSAVFTPMEENPDAFQFLLPGAYLNGELEALAQFFARRILHWTASGLNLRTHAETRETTIFGMATLPWEGPHLFHSAELGPLEVKPVEVQDKGAVFTITSLDITAGI